MPTGLVGKAVAELADGAGRQRHRLRRVAQSAAGSRRSVTRLHGVGIGHPELLHDIELAPPRRAGGRRRVVLERDLDRLCREVLSTGRLTPLRRCQRMVVGFTCSHLSTSQGTGLMRSCATERDRGYCGRSTSRARRLDRAGPCAPGRSRKPPPARAPAPPRVGDDARADSAAPRRPPAAPSLSTWRRVVAGPDSARRTVVRRSVGSCRPPCLS